jgi:beta-galactosidase
MKSTPLFLLLLCVAFNLFAQKRGGEINFDRGWKFTLRNDEHAKEINYNDSQWRSLNVPHDWSIEGSFSKDNPSTTNEAALPTGVGWYRKTFILAGPSVGRHYIIRFDGVYRNSEAWINGHYLGKRPNGYITFEYNLTPFLSQSGKPNVIAVKVDNSAEPNSRWYSGSGIYRHVWLINTAKTYFINDGTFITTPKINMSAARLNIETSLKKAAGAATVKAIIYDDQNKPVGFDKKPVVIGNDSLAVISLSMKIHHPRLWFVDKPYLYKTVLQVISNQKVLDTYTIFSGIRYFKFDEHTGFSLNGKRMKINGVCMHHDLGALGSAVNTSAMQRQLQILKDMGCNAIRTSHNPPAPEFLDLCDRMGFIVLDEAFDMWAKKKNKNDYHLDWAQWHQRDLEDQIRRDRNHPSVMMWSIGNEIREQFDSTGISITKELVGVVKKLDATRPVTSALSENDPKKNFIYQSAALDLVGLNYHQEAYADFPKNYPGQKFIATETVSALESRGHYDMPSDSVRHWPHDGKSKFTDGNADFTVSAYDNVAAYWGSTHEETWKIIKKHDFLSGMFIWTGFDYLGEPTPYPWPARSSYFGIVDLAGFPKDVYYMYQSEWTNKPVLHIFPHWNWQPGKVVDVWAYYNQADEVELFLNGRSLGVKRKEGDELHVMWHVPYTPGVLTAVSRREEQTVLTRQIKTADMPYKIELSANKRVLNRNGRDMLFVTIKILDKDGNLVPTADNDIKLNIAGAGRLAGMDNGCQTSVESFKGNHHHAFNGLCLGIVQSLQKSGSIIINCTSPGLKGSVLKISAKNK